MTDPNEVYPTGLTLTEAEGLYGYIILDRACSRPSPEPMVSLERKQSKELHTWLISSAADVALVVDKSGVIKDVAIGSEDLAKAGLGAWIGLPWTETVTSDSRHKVEELMREAALKKPARWREVNHIAPGGGHMLVRYSVL
jgi:hypothetical protein